MPLPQPRIWSPAASGAGGGVAPAPYARLELRLPRRGPSVTTARHVVERGLSDVGVAGECRADIMIALSEACSNAVEHANRGKEYEVIVTVDRACCTVEVIDSGVGLQRHDPEPANLTAERGRGLHLIRAVTDRLEMRRVYPHGLAVRMIKNLIWRAGAPVGWTGISGDAWSVVRP